VIVTDGPVGAPGGTRKRSEIVGGLGVDDAGVGDAGADDAGVGDAGADDAGVGDAGADDAGVGDAGVGDAGVGDAGVGDAGVGDAGVGDAGVGDAGADDAGLTSLLAAPACKVAGAIVGLVVSCVASAGPGTDTVTGIPADALGPDTVSRPVASFDDEVVTVWGGRLIDGGETGPTRGLLSVSVSVPVSVVDATVPLPDESLPLPLCPGLAAATAPVPPVNMTPATTQATATRRIIDRSMTSPLHPRAQRSQANSELVDCRIFVPVEGFLRNFRKKFSKRHRKGAAVAGDRAPGVRAVPCWTQKVCRPPTEFPLVISQASGVAPHVFGATIPMVHRYPPGRHRPNTGSSY
jgi:hypothetical protein